MKPIRSTAVFRDAAQRGQIAVVPRVVNRGGQLVINAGWGFFNAEDAEDAELRSHGDAENVHPAGEGVIKSESAMAR